MSALAYLRLSEAADEQLKAEGRDAISRQRDDIRQLATRHNVDLPDSAFYFEDDVSGSKVRKDKTEWAKLLKVIESEKPEYLFGTVSNRLGRRLADLEGLEELCRATGTKVITLKEGDLFKSPYWPVIAGIAKTEALQIADRVKRAQTARRAAGKDSGGGQRPFGYTINRMAIVEKERPIVEEIFRRTIDGESSLSIAKDMQARGVRAAQSIEWRASTVRRIVANARYMGMNIYKGQVAGKAAWPAIIDRAIFEAANAALSHTTPRKGRPVKSLLGGILRCECGQTMTATRAGRNNIEIYRCSGGRGYRAGCGKTYRARDVVEGYVIERLLTDINSSVIAEERWRLNQQMEPLQDAITTSTVELAELEDLFKQRKLSAGTYSQMWDDLTTQQSQAEKKHGALMQRYAVLGKGGVARERWEDWSSEERRTYLAQRIERVDLHQVVKGQPSRPLADDEIVIHWL